MSVVPAVLPPDLPAHQKNGIAEACASHAAFLMQIQDSIYKSSDNVCHPLVLQHYMRTHIQPCATLHNSITAREEEKQLDS